MRPSDCNFTFWSRNEPRWQQIRHVPKWQSFKGKHKESNDNYKTIAVHNGQNACFQNFFKISIKKTPK